MTNPKGSWILHNFEYLYRNDDISSIYGKVYPVYSEIAKVVIWYWEANVGLGYRMKGLNVKPFGWVDTEEHAKEIVEKLLLYTKTVEE